MRLPTGTAALWGCFPELGRCAPLGPYRAEECLSSSKVIAERCREEQTYSDSNAVTHGRALLCGIMD